MTKVAAELTELKDTTVTRVSLVKHAATRMPFRILKHDIQQENDMGINLSAVGKAFSVTKRDLTTKAAGPEVVAVVLNGLDAALEDKVVKALADAGLDMPKVTKTEAKDEAVATTAFHAEGADLAAEGNSLVKISDDVVMVVKGFSPWSDDVSKAPFAEQVKAQGFYTDLRTAAEVMTGVVQKSLYDAADKAASVAEIRKSLTEFGTYVEGLVNGLPEQAFKGEAAVAAVLKADKVAKAEAAAAPVVEAKKEEAAPAGAAAAAEPTAKAEVPSDILVELQKTMTGLAESFGALSSEVKKSQVATEQKIAEIARKAETAAKAVQTTVAAGAQGGDEPSGETTKKNEDFDPRTGAFDSGFFRSRN